MPNDVLAFLTSLLNAVSHFLTSGPMIYLTVTLIAVMLVHIFTSLISPNRSK